MLKFEEPGHNFIELEMIHDSKLGDFLCIEIGEIDYPWDQHTFCLNKAQIEQLKKLLGEG